MRFMDSIRRGNTGLQATLLMRIYMLPIVVHIFGEGKPLMNKSAVFKKS